MKHPLIQFIRFSRPHTIIGTTLSVTALFVLSCGYNGQPLHAYVGVWAFALLACLCANIYIVGLNQLTDIEIDKINKPYLPLASGAFSLKTGRHLVAISLLLALALPFFGGRYLAWTVWLSLALGTAYSLPPFRLKRFPFWAAFCIIAVRGLIVNLLLFLHFNNLMGGTPVLPPLVKWLTVAIFVFGLIIAWFKDMPDTSGDEAHAIRTLSITLGVRTVFLAGTAILAALFGLLAALPVLGLIAAKGVLFSSGHLLFAAFLLYAAYRANLSDGKSIARFYQQIWLLFFAEYLLFALAAVPA